MGSKKMMIALVSLLVLVVGAFLLFFLLDDEQSSDVDEQDSASTALLPPPSEPRDLDAPSLEVRSDEEELEDQLDAAVEQALQEAEEESSGDAEAASGDGTTSDVTAASREGWTEYNNTLYDYAFDVPSEWNRGPETTPTAWVATYTTYRSDATSNVNELPGTKLEVVVQENTEGLSLDELAADTKLLATAVHSETTMTLGEYEARRIEADLPSGRSVLVVAVRDLDVFTLTFTGRDTQADATEVNGVLESFVL